MLIIFVFIETKISSASFFFIILHSCCFFSPTMIYVLTCLDRGGVLSFFIAMRSCVFLDTFFCSSSQSKSVLENRFEIVLALNSKRL